VAEKTGGDSLRSNMSLVKRNAEVGADIANSIVDLTFGRGKEEWAQSSQLQSSSHKPRVVCVGGAVIDTVAKSSAENEMIIGTSNPGSIHVSDGGVARNVAEVLGRLGSKPLFYTAIGNDDGGRGILARLRNECGVVTTTESAYVSEGVSTAQYLALLDHRRDLVGGVADMEALSQIPVPSMEELRGVEFLVLDSNAPVETLTRAAKNGVNAGTRVCFEPTSIPKAQLLSNNHEFLECLTYTFPNEAELFAMAESLSDGVVFNEGQNSSEEYKPLKHAASKLLSKMNSENPHIIVTLGSRGVLLASKSDSSSTPVFKHLPATAMSDIKSSNGAGDTLCGAFIHALLQGASEEEAVRFGQKAARMSLDCAEHAISPDVRYHH